MLSAPPHSYERLGSTPNGLSDRARHRVVGVGSKSVLIACSGDERKF